MNHAEPVPVHLDTDIGSNIDDAFCLAYLLRHPRAALVGITTVSGEASIRARIASALCRAAGRPDLPISPGCENPLLAEPLQPRAQQAAALADLPHRTDFPAGEAPRLIHESVEAHPGRLVVVAVGPLTNIAVWLALYPKDAARVACLVTMGGLFGPTTHGDSFREWNFRLDPHAAAAVLKTSFPRHILLGLEVSSTLTGPRRDVEERLSSPPEAGAAAGDRGAKLRGAIAGLLSAWSRHGDFVAFHDALAAALALDPDRCPLSRMAAAVETSSPDAAGLVHLHPDPDGRHEVVASADPDAFLGELWGVVGYSFSTTAP